MALPSLGGLSLCRAGVVETNGGDDDVGMEVLAPTPRRDLVKDLVSNALGRVREQLVNAPWMLCLQDKDAPSLDAARQAKAFLKQYREGFTGAMKQFDDQADYDRYTAAVAEGKRVPVVTAYKRQILRPILDSLNIVKERLLGLLKSVAAELGAHIWYGNPHRRGNNMGLEVTYTSEYGEPDYFPFHTDMPESGVRAHLPSNVGDWTFLTMVYYLLDEDGEALAKGRTGHGSTVYNLQQKHMPDDDTRVAFCPLLNGSITIFNGSKFHAVGPNSGIERGAVVLKAVLYKKTQYRSWTHAEWWRRAQASMLRLACAPGSGFGHNKHAEQQLCTLLRFENAESVPPEAKRSRSR